MRLRLASASAVHSFLAFDFGTARVGVASGNSLTAQRDAAVHRRGAGRGPVRGDRPADRRVAAGGAGRRRAASIPTAPRTSTPSGARRFARQLKARFGLPVHEVDERYTTTAARAERRARPRRRRGGADPRAVPGEGRMSRIELDAEALYAGLLAGVRGLLKPDGALVGIWSGGAWLAERLQRDCGLRRRSRRDLEHAASRRLLARAASPPAPTTPGCRSRSRAATSS